MRLIDKDSLLEIINANKPLADGYHMKDYVFEQILHDIDNEPTIDAIPIDWIRKEQNKLLKSNDIENIKRAEWLNGMVHRWRKDNE